MGGAADDGRRVHGVVAAGDSGEAKERVVVGEGVVSGVVTEGTFPAPFFRIHETLENDFSFRRYQQVHTSALDDIHRPVAEKTGEDSLVETGRKRSGGCIDGGGVGTEGHGHRRWLAPAAVCPIVTGAVVMAVPVHAGCLTVEDLQAVHPDILLSRLGVPGDDQRQGDESSAVVGPALHDR